MSSRAVLLLPLAVVTIVLLHCGGDPVQGAEEPVDAGPDGSRRDPKPEPDDGDGSVEDRASTEGAGTRFSPMYIERTFDDGTTVRQFADRFWDRALNEMCSIREIGPNIHACTPFLESAFEGFSDAACTKPAIVAPTPFSMDLPLRRHVELEGSSWCAPRIVRINGVPTAPGYRRGPDGECELYPGTTQLVPANAANAVPTFGVFTRTKDATERPDERGGTRLAVERWRFTGPDGSFEVRPPRIIDLVHQAEGSVAVGMDKKLRLFPALRRALSHNGFADATCTTSLVSFPDEEVLCHEEPYRSDRALQRALVEPGCLGTRLVLPPPDPPLQVTYRNHLGTCVEGDPPWGIVHPASAVQELASDSLVEVTRQLAPNDSAVLAAGSKLEARSVVHSSKDGLMLRQRAWRLYLRKYDVPCESDYFEDPSDERCIPDVPRDTSQGAHFADASCSEPVLVLSNASDCEAAPFYRTSSGVFKRPPGAPLALTSVYLKEGNGTCRALPAYPESYVYLAAAGKPEEIPISEFPKLELMDLSYE